MFGLVLGTAGVETHHTTPDGRSLPIFGESLGAGGGRHLLGGERRLGGSHSAALGLRASSVGRRGTLHPGGWLCSEDAAKAAMVHLFTEALATDAAG